MRARIRSGLAVVVATSALLVTPSSPAYAVDVYQYAGPVGDANHEQYGIDGYIRSSTSYTLSTYQHRANWFNLCNASCAWWVQIGQYQGNLGGMYSGSTTRVYTEDRSPCDGYTPSDFAPPSAPNEAYYIYFDGATFTDPCGNTLYEYKFKRGSFSSSQIQWGYMIGSHGAVYASTELWFDAVNGSLPPNGTDYYGTDDAHAPDASHGIHTQAASGGSWALWTPTTVPLSALRSSNPPTVHVTNNYWSFYTN